jgi:type IV pilus assembly protein PilE
MEAPRTSARRSRGFTLIELVIAMVIAAILVALAYPSLMGSIRKGRRSEAMAALTALQQEEERWRSNNQSYTDSLVNLRITTPTNPGRYYALSFVGTPSATAYTALADGSGSSQGVDANCVKMAVKVDRGNISYASCKDCAAADLVFAPSDACWAR